MKTKAPKKIPAKKQHHEPTLQELAAREKPLVATAVLALKTKPTKETKLIEKFTIDFWSLLSLYNKKLVLPRHGKKDGIGIVGETTWALSAEGKRYQKALLAEGWRLV